jgi:radical SAM/Cys-rich protein
LADPDGGKSVQTVDLTGGAPELSPHFRFAVEESRRLKRHVIDRCNLVVFFERGQEDLPEFLRQHQVEVIASLPCYTPDNVQKQRGRQVYDDSILALRRLNQLGYGQSEHPELQLNLVYNPGGAALPGAQAALEADYRRELWDRHQLRFNHLYTITNMPIRRFADDLVAQGLLQSYMQLLVDSFNPATVRNLMCLDTVNVRWDGQVADCDFNSALDQPVLRGQLRGAPSAADLRSHLPLQVSQLRSFAELASADIRTDKHCFGCTAGAGSSCGGALA